MAILIALSEALFAYRPLRKLLFSAGTTRSSQPAALPQTEIVAVLPFSTPNADPKLAALGEGLLESLAAKLSKLTEDRAFEIVPPRNLQDRKITPLPDPSPFSRPNPPPTAAIS